jgi:hypothetical protein
MDNLWTSGKGGLRLQTSAEVLDTAHYRGQIAMCRSIRTLFNFEPPVTDSEIRAASLQFVRKISGYNTPSKTNEAVFFSAVDEITSISGHLLASLEATAAPKNRREEAAKAKARADQRFGR